MVRIKNNQNFTILTTTNGDKVVIDKACWNLVVPCTHHVQTIHSNGTLDNRDMAKPEITRLLLELGVKNFEKPYLVHFTPSL